MDLLDEKNINKNDNNYGISKLDKLLNCNNNKN
jgi:hypothetical protein